MAEIKFEYDFGDIVYLITDKEKVQRLIVGYHLKPGGIIRYEINTGIDNSYHYDFELTKDENKIQVNGYGSR